MIKRRDTKLDNKELQEKVRKNSLYIDNAIRGYAHRSDYTTFAGMTYLLYKVSVQINPNITYQEILASLKPEEQMLIEDCLSGIDINQKMWEDLKNFAMHSGAAVFAQILLQPSFNTMTEYTGERPESIL